MSIEPSSLECRARIHAALGDPARLAIVDALALGDASPGEIAHDLRLATNLVAHHVKVLTEAGLVTRGRSEGDRRRTYLRLRPETLAALAPPALTCAGRVVFVCTHNSARSQFAAALWRRRTGGSADSAGVDPAPGVHPAAVRAAGRLGIDLQGSVPKGFEAVADEPGLVVSVCDRAREADIPFDAPALHWSVADPVADGRQAAFRVAFADILSRVERLASALPSDP
jgi:protein-tyrosine-phosphatase/DNA-binding HxlR family transcriptional regulator